DEQGRGARLDLQHLHGVADDDLVLDGDTGGGGRAVCSADTTRRRYAAAIPLLRKGIAAPSLRDGG
ncbi:hypothetical protein AB0911_35705, partial [Streptomyces nigra]|uniref:hypothetical protein n=1 Tax=Streptomyces nigra TaxID=1827580 RepID=UPI003455F640